MTKRTLFLLLFTLTALTTVAQANVIGSLPFALFNVQENGTNLLVSTREFTSSATLTSGPGKGGFSPVPIGTPFSVIAIDDTMVGTGGGFFVTNSTWGTFTATSGSIQSQTTSAVVFNLKGPFTPGPGLGGGPSEPADVTLAFTQTGASISGSFTLATTIPEPGTLMLAGTGGLILFLLLPRVRKIKI
jgi:hypothetical protein